MNENLVKVQACIARKIIRDNYSWPRRIWAWFASDKVVNEWLIGDNWHWRESSFGSHCWYHHTMGSYSALEWAFRELHKK